MSLQDEEINPENVNPDDVDPNGDNDNQVAPDDQEDPGILSQQGMNLIGQLLGGNDAEENKNEDDNNEDNENEENNNENNENEENNNENNENEENNNEDNGNEGDDNNENENSDHDDDNNEDDNDNEAVAPNDDEDLPQNDDDNENNINEENAVNPDDSEQNAEEDQHEDDHQEKDQNEDDHNDDDQNSNDERDVHSNDEQENHQDDDEKPENDEADDEEKKSENGKLENMGENLMGKLMGSDAPDDESDHGGEEEDEHQTEDNIQTQIDDDDFEKLDDEDGEVVENEDTMMITETANVVRPPKYPKSSTTGRRQKSYTDTSPQYSDEEIQEQIRIMEKDKKLPDSCYHQPIRNYISRLQLEATKAGKYKRAEELEAQLDLLNDLLNQQSNERDASANNKLVQDKIDMVTSLHNEKIKKLNEKRDKRQQEYEQGLKDMETRHETEITQFQNECSNPDFLSKYNKPSQKLISLRKSENQLAMAKHFDRAKKVQAQADELQRYEQAEASRKLNDSVQLKLQTILERHNRERECLEQRNQSDMETLGQKMHKEEMTYQNALAMLNTQMKSNDTKNVTMRQTSKRPLRNNMELTQCNTPATLDLPQIDLSKFTKSRKIVKPSTSTTKKREK